MTVGVSYVSEKQEKSLLLESVKLGYDKLNEQKTMGHEKKRYNLRKNAVQWAVGDSQHKKNT